MIAVSLLLFAAFFCPAAGVNALEDPLVIAFVGDFSDVTQDYCRRAFEAAEMAVREFNEQGGLLGRQVVMIKRDGGNDPNRHYRHISELGGRKDVLAIFGGGSSAVLLAASQAALEQGIPYLISVGNSQSVVVQHGHPFVFLFEANSYMETKAFSIFATLMPWRKYGWIGPDYVWGREVFDYYQQHFEALGTPIEWVVEAWHPLDSREFVPLIKQIIEARPEALVIASWGQDLPRIIEQSKPYDLFGKTATFSLFMAEDPQVTVQEGMWSMTRAPFSYLAKKYLQTKQFVDRFHDQYQAYPSGFSICSYDALLAWREAVLKAASADRSAVAEALKGLTFEGLRGTSHIRAIDGQMNCPTFFGRTVYQPGLPFPTMDPVIEIPAAKTWPSEQEVLAARKKTDDS